MTILKILSGGWINRSCIFSCLFNTVVKPARLESRFSANAEEQSNSKTTVINGCRIMFSILYTVLYQWLIWWNLSLKENYDIIFVDGAHNADDVYFDAKNSCKHLNKGGYLIFDDFFCNEFQNKSLLFLSKQIPLIEFAQLKFALSFLEIFDFVFY